MVHKTETTSRPAIRYDKVSPVLYLDTGFWALIGNRLRLSMTKNL